MKNQIATTPEQSQRLIACGVNPDTADMFYTNYHKKPNDKMPIVKTAPLGIRTDLIPAWSLSALLALMPQSIKADSLEFDIEITAGWRVCYVYYDDILECFDATDPIECCVKAVEWLTKYGYNLNKD